jgi:uncharacterized protein YjbI with pentapeptide repeats
MPIETGDQVVSAAESRSWRRAPASIWKHRAEVALGVLFVLAWWLVPPLLYRRDGAGPDAQLRAITDTRTALLAGLVGLSALLTFRLSSRAGRNAACSAQAIEQLASDTLVVRLGGIYSLERLAKVSVRDQPMVMEVLSAFVRAHSNPAPTLPGAVGKTPTTLAQDNGQAAGERPPETSQQQRPTPTVDVRAALTVLGRLPPRPEVDRADLANAYLAAAALSGTKLSGFRLVGANLNQADLAGADLERAQLQRATLQGAWLQKASLRQANLQAAHLEQADLERADLQDANLPGTWLGWANLTDANLTRADLGRANLVKANLQGADLGEANLGEADLRGANLRGAWLGQTNLAGANLTRADLRGAYLSEANLREAELKGANLNGVNLSGVVGLTRAQLDVALLNLETRLGHELELPEPTDAPDSA